MRVDCDGPHHCGRAWESSSGSSRSSRRRVRRVHRKSGMVFVYAMLTMALMGATMAVVRGKAPAAQRPGGTSDGVSRHHRAHHGPPTLRGIALAGIAARCWLCWASRLALFTFGFEAFASPQGKLHGMPALPFLIFGSVGLLAAVGDFRLIRSGVFSPFAARLDLRDICGGCVSRW